MSETKEKVGEVVLKNVRLSFADIYKPGKPRKGDDGEEKPGSFSANFLLDKKDPETKAKIALIKKACDEARAKKWGDNPDKWPKLKPDRVCLRDGELEDWDGYAGNFYVSTNSNRKPVVITNRRGPDKKWVEAAEGAANSPYSGCYVNAVVRVWAQDHADYGKRLNASVELIQFFKDGEAFGAGPVNPEDYFGDDDVSEEGDFTEDDDDYGSDLV